MTGSGFRHDFIFFNTNKELTHSTIPQQSRQSPMGTHGESILYYRYPRLRAKQYYNITHTQ